MESTEYRASADDKGVRLDVFVAGRTGITRSQVQKLVGEGSVLVNSRPKDPGLKLKEGDVVTVIPPAPEETALHPEDVPLTILYMDDDLVAVDKPAGMVVYPAAGHEGGTLMNALAFRAPHLASIGGPLRPGVVHRLDKDTSGVMVVALSDNAYYNLVEQFRHRTMERKYLVLVAGALRSDAGEIALAIGRSTSDRKKMSTRTRRGKEALTRWTVSKRLTGATLIEARLGTGRTHQIRVHFAAIGHPVLGDRTYGKRVHVEVRGKRIPVPRQMLHAETLGFTHPTTGELLRFSSTMPEDMRELLEMLSS